MTVAMDQFAPGAVAAVNHHPWDAVAEGWNQHAVLIHDWLLQATTSMLDEARIGSGSRVLDIAAGAGDQTLEIARRVGASGWVLATDIAPGLLALAEKNARTAGLLQIATQLADAESLGMEGADFDSAVCRLGLMFCRKPLAALSGIRAALKPGGRFSAIVFTEPQRNPCLVIALNTARKHAGFASFSNGGSGVTCEPGSLMSLGKPDLFRELLQTAGFTDVQIRHVSAPFHAPTVTHYTDFLRASALPVIEILAPLSAAVKERAWADITEELNVFSLASGWAGPNELLLANATAPS